MPNNQEPVNETYLDLMDKAEKTLDSALQQLALAKDDPDRLKVFDRMHKAAETYRDFSAMFRGQPNV